VTDEKNILAALRQHKTLLIVVGVCLVLIEIEIFAVAAMKSGRKSLLKVMDGNGVVVYETDGANLSRFDKYYFEQTFGPFEQYQTRLVSTDVPFPFRAWFAAAFGMPVGLVLLFAFVVKTYTALFYGDRKHPKEYPDPTTGSESRLERTLRHLSRLNIFTIGFLIFLLVFSYWVVPNFFVYMGRLGVETLSRYKWLLIVVAGVFLALVVWVIYLRYLIAKKAVEQRAEVDKYRLQLEFHNQPKEIGSVGYNGDDVTPCLTASWEACGEDADSDQVV
jgi:hypothetical protein